MLPDNLSEFANAIAHGAEMPETMRGGKSYGIDQGIEIYRNNYFGNLEDALACAYPVTRQLVGEDFFSFMAREYILDHPSKSGNLNFYGEGMADFLDAFERSRSLAYLPDVARLEWACHRAYFAEDANAMDVAALAGISQERHADLILRIHPACALVQSDYPISAIWQAHQPGGAFDIANSACRALVSRVDGAVTVSELSPAEADFFLSIKTGRTLLDAAYANGDGFDLQGILFRLFGMNAFCGFELKGS